MYKRQAIGTAVAGTVGVTGIAVGTAIAIGVATVVVGAYVGTQLIGMANMDFSETMSAQARSVLSNQQGSTNPLPVIYGKRRVGGTPIFYHVSGDNNEFLHIVYAIAEGEIQGVSQIYFNNDPILETTFSIWYGAVQGLNDKYKNVVKFEIYNGTETQTADSDLILETDGIWTSSDKLQGVAYAIIRLEFVPEIFGNTGIPQVNFDVIGKKTRSVTSGLSLIHI